MRHDQIVAWVERHRADLPTDLAGLARYPVRFRSVIVNAVGPEQRTRLWTEHLQSFLEPESRFSLPQREFICTTITELPQLLSAPAPNPTMIEWEGRASRLFTRREASELFGTVGPPEPPEGLPLPPDAFPDQQA